MKDAEPAPSEVRRREGELVVVGGVDERRALQEVRDGGRRDMFRVLLFDEIAVAEPVQQPPDDEALDGRWYLILARRDLGELVGGA